MTPYAYNKTWSNSDMEKDRRQISIISIYIMTMTTLSSLLELAMLMGEACRWPINFIPLHII